MSSEKGGTQEQEENLNTSSGLPRIEETAGPNPQRSQAASRNMKQNFPLVKYRASTSGGGGVLQVRQISRSCRMFSLTLDSATKGYRRGSSQLFNRTDCAPPANPEMLTAVICSAPELGTSTCDSRWTVEEVVERETSGDQIRPQKNLESSLKCHLNFRLIPMNEPVPDVWASFLSLDGRVLEQVVQNEEWASCLREW